jgi:hypothetical protein
MKASSSNRGTRNRSGKTDIKTWIDASWNHVQSTSDLKYGIRLYETSFENFIYYHHIVNTKFNLGSIR